MAERRGTNLQDADAILQKLVAADSQSTSKLRALGLAQEYEGKRLDNLERPADALVQYRLSLDSIAKALARDASDLSLISQELASREALSLCLAHQGDHDAALTAAQTAATSAAAQSQSAQQAATAAQAAVVSAQAAVTQAQAALSAAQAQLAAAQSGGYEFLHAAGERSLASIKILGPSRGAMVAARACWREGESSWRDRRAIQRVVPLQWQVRTLHGPGREARRTHMCPQRVAGQAGTCAQLAPDSCVVKQQPGNAPRLLSGKYESNAI